MNTKSTKTKQLLYPQKLNSVRYLVIIDTTLMPAGVLYGMAQFTTERWYQLTQELNEVASCCPSSTPPGQTDRAW